MDAARASCWAPCRSRLARLPPDGATEPAHYESCLFGLGASKQANKLAGWLAGGQVPASARTCVRACVRACAPNLGRSQQAHKGPSSGAKIPLPLLGFFALALASARSRGERVSEQLA